MGIATLLAIATVHCWAGASGLPLKHVQEHDKANVWTNALAAPAAADPILAGRADHNELRSVGPGMGRWIPAVNGINCLIMMIFAGCGLLRMATDPKWSLFTLCCAMVKKKLPRRTRCMGIPDAGGAACDTANDTAKANPGKKVLSVREAGFVLTAMLFSTQVFMGAHAFALSGLWGGLLALVGSWAANLATGFLLGETLHAAHELDPSAESTYEAVGKAAFGPLFGHVSAFFGLGELYLYGVWWAVSFGINLPLLADRLGFHLSAPVAIAGATSLAVAGTLVPERNMSYICLGGIFVLVSCAIMTALAVLMLPEWAPEHHGLDVSTLGSSFSIFTFGFAAHATFPSTYAVVEEPRKLSFQHALSQAFITSLVGTGALSVIVYWGYGQAAAPLCTANLGHDIHGAVLPETWAALLQLAALACFSIKSLSSWPLCLRPLGNWLANKGGWCLPPGITDEASLLPKYPGLYLTRLLCNILVGGSVGALGITLATEIRLITEFTAALFMGVNAFVFPAACYLKLSRRAGTYQKLAVTAVLIIGISYMVSGLAGLKPPRR
mmetsp:Transcript_131825/g.263073  ORF Transcript_131825/g.263073 Transcript_131825/m.263073 type:complete len:555 (-) Transcript_131825:53-1717(-)